MLEGQWKDKVPCPESALASAGRNVAYVIHWHQSRAASGRDFPPPCPFSSLEFLAAATMSQNFQQLPEELQLATSAHVKYIQGLDTRKDEYDYWLTEHLRLNGLYWGLTALHLLGHPDALPRAETIDFVLSCQHESGGFGAAPGHDAHMLSTVSAVQILAMVDAFDELETRGKGGKAQVGKCASNRPRRGSGFSMLT